MINYTQQSCHIATFGRIMRIIIKQKYFTVGAKFEIQDKDRQTVFFAERQWDRILANVVLFSPDGAPVARMQAALKKLFTSWFSITDSRGNEVCSIHEKLPFFCFHRAETANGALHINIKAGPFHMKAHVVTDSGKTLAVKARKKLLSIRDTYVIDIDETVINPAYGVLVGLWYDLVCHPSR